MGWPEQALKQQGERRGGGSLALFFPLLLMHQEVVRRNLEKIKRTSERAVFVPADVCREEASELP